MKCIILLAVLVALVAVAHADRPQSDCEKHRDGAEKIDTIMKLIPKCKDNGDYEELQCYTDSKFCVCYDKNGHAASPISSNIKYCGCFLRKKERLDMNIDNAHVLKCAADGNYLRMECYNYNDNCWCVDENGERTTDVKPDYGKGLPC